jgi:hypothetical protein
MDKNKLREELFEKCIELGLPVGTEDDIDKLSFYLENATDFDDDEDLEDLYDEQDFIKKTSILKKVFSIVFYFNTP